MISIVKKLVSIVAVTALSLSLISVGASAAVISEEQVPVIVNTTSSSSGTFSVNDSNRPTSYHNRDVSDYYYDGHVGSAGRLYSMKYFSTTTDGCIFVEGLALSRYKKNGKAQNVIMEVYEVNVDTPHYVITLESDCVIETHADYQKMYYRFAIINLDPNKLYYIAFRNAEENTGLDVYGYLSHHWTNYYNY